MMVYVVTVAYTEEYTTGAAFTRYETVGVYRTPEQANVKLDEFFHNLVERTNYNCEIESCSISEMWLD